MKRLLLLALLVASAQAAYILNPVIRATLVFDTNAKATAARTWLLQRYDETNLVAFANYGKVEANISTNLDKKIQVDLAVALKSAAKAEAIWQQITNYSFPSGVRGFVSIHYCVIDPTNTFGWGGCRTEPQAQYREKTF